MDKFLAKVRRYKIRVNKKIQKKNYNEKDVNRGLRNANGTGVVVGLTHIGEVVG